MLTESIRPIEQIPFNNNVTRFDRNGETFQDILQYYLDNGRNSRSPKIEITGILIPFEKFVGGRAYKFKLESETTEYILSMSKDLEGIAKKLEWEKVTVKGLLDLYTNILEVEKISLSNTNDPIKTALPLEDAYGEVEYYEKTIAQRGILEPSLDYLVS